MNDDYEILRSLSIENINELFGDIVEADSELIGVSDGLGSASCDKTV